jgi:hypothetical protein
MFYDWQGAWVFQPGVQFVRDPFRFIVDYTAVVGPRPAVRRGPRQGQHPRAGRVRVLTP